MVRIKDEQMLLEKLVSDVEECGKEKIVLMGGHFPLFYTEDSAVEATKYWGEFSNYTLELVSNVGRYAKSIGKEVEYLFFVDDHSYEDMSGMGSRKRSRKRNELYKERSGEGAQLSQDYRKIMGQYGFSEDDVVRHDHGKKGREDCLYFSEKILRASKREVDNICAREYTEFIEDPNYFDKAKSHIISFMPSRCKGHICDVALDEEINGLSASHVFMETMMPLATREELYSCSKGVIYRRD